MSGHSHWSTIKHQKEAADKKRGQLFSKLSRAITISAKKGSDPQTNPGLRIAIEQAKKTNMPSDNIERAVKKGTGELTVETLEEFCFEAYGPAKSALIITGITDNKVRALNQIRQILSSSGGKLAQEGAVKWQFEPKGIIIILAQSNNENLEMTVIESGAENMRWENGFLEVYTKPEDLEKTKKEIEGKKIPIESASLGWVAKEEMVLDESGAEKLKKLFFALNDEDDVQEVYSNVRM